MDEQKKISLPEAILMVMIVGSAELFELIATFAEAIPVIGQILLFIKWFVALFSWLAVQFWLIMKGIKGMWFLGGGVLDMAANFLGADIPFGKTVTLIMTIYIANHPKVAQIAQVATGKVAGPAGKALKGAK